MPNKYYDPLYSRDGGPAQAFRCLMESTEPDHAVGVACGTVIRTARGMEAHLHMVHNFKSQITLDELIKKEEGHGKSRE